MVTFNLDEYYPMRPDSIHSYNRYMWENLFDEINVTPANVHVPRGDIPRDQVVARTKSYEQAIRDAGGIDFQILGIGKTGHIGFNEPGSGIESRTRLIALDTVTRRDAAADFFGEDNVPTEAITMGVATIMEAREIALVATGEHKSAIIKRAVEGDPDPDVAATYLQLHPNAVFYVDPAAAADLTRVRTPWVTGEVEWTHELEVAAVIWLSEVTGKSILKLDSLDYREHHLSSLLARYQMAGPQRRDFQCPDLQGARPEQAAFAPEYRRVLATPRRRRHLHGRNSPQAAPERQSHRRCLSDVRQHRRVRPRSAPLSGFHETCQWRSRYAAVGNAASDREGREISRIQGAGPDGHPSDPHGTHRMCLETVQQSLEQYSGDQPEMWYYRGAWQEWDVGTADVLVPLSEDELRWKILAIFKHQSQKDRAPFPGQDEREFWQRVDERNKHTAAVVDRLGLPEYFAMEAYVVRRDGAPISPETVPTSALGSPTARPAPPPRAR